MLFETGYEVGDLAKELFAGGVEIEFDSSDFDGMIKQTKVIKSLFSSPDLPNV